MQNNKVPLLSVDERNSARAALRKKGFITSGFILIGNLLLAIFVVFANKGADLTVQLITSLCALLIHGYSIFCIMRFLKALRQSWIDEAREIHGSILLKLGARSDEE